MQFDGGLILEGGGMRGIYTVGVLDYFMKKNIYFKDCLGVSAGAIHGTSYLSKQPKRAMKIVLKYLEEKQYASFTAWMITGNYFDRRFHTQVLPKQLFPYDYETAYSNPMKLYAVVTQCESGKAEYKRIQDVEQDIDWVWASGSLPLFARTVKIEGRHYLDGSIADSIPVKKSIEMGNAKNVVVLTRDAAYRKKQEASLPIVKVKYREYPNFVKAVEDRPDKYNETIDFIEQEEKAGRLIVIRPSKPITIGRLEKDREALKELYKQGFLDAKEAYKKILNYFGVEE